jgi:hypothetical protein
MLFEFSMRGRFLFLSVYRVRSVYGYTAQREEEICESRTSGVS